VSDHGAAAGATLPAVDDDLTTGGQVLPITRWGTPVMHAATRPVEQFDDELRTLVRDMFATMEAASGVGLAANQVGRDLAVFVFDCPDEAEVRHVGVVCNPVVELPEGKDRNLDAADEGCLSYPGAYETLARPDHAICRGQDVNGLPVEIHGDGLLARCLQHETDHLNGTVFGDRLSGRSRKKLRQQHDDLAARYPDDWPVSPRTGPADDEDDDEDESEL
jgi:peptide deformylase